MSLLTRRSSAAAAPLQSLRFFGTGPNWADPYIDRVRVLIDAGSGQSVYPANIGGGDFTVEMFLLASSSNAAGAVTTGANNNWINGNTFFDRDRFSQNRAFGLSLGAGIPVFGLTDAAGAARTIAATTDIRGSNWYHVAFTRAISTGDLAIYVGSRGQTGNREALFSAGPTGTLEYPNGATPNSSCGELGNQVCSESDPYMVFGAEKHDAGASFPSYFGYMTEVRLSNSVRYTGATYSVPSARFANDANTVALYHMTELSGTILDASGNDRHGTMEVGGPSNGPQRSPLSPF